MYEARVISESVAIDGEEARSVAADARTNTRTNTGPETRTGAEGGDSARAAELKASIRQFIEHRFPLAREAKLSDEASLLEAGAVDSLGILDIVVHLEETYRLTVEDEDLQPSSFESIHALSQFVLSRLA